MTYTADKKMFISEFMKVMIFCNILHLIMFAKAMVGVNDHFLISLHRYF